jgi:hypothetical protein
MNRTSIFASTRNLTARLMNAEGEGSVGGSATPEVKLTRSEKLAAQIVTLEKRIAADTAKVEEVKAELEVTERLASVGVGTLIVAKLGRAETARSVDAEVLGVKDDENGARRYKISFGEGFDADTVVIQPAQIAGIRGQVS